MQSTTEPAPTTEKRSKKLDRSLTSITAISFSLTFVGVIIALLAGFLPRNFALLEIDAQVDTGVMLLFVPLCALVLAIVAEVLRAAMRGPVRPQVPRLRRPLSNWQSGHGKG